MDMRDDRERDREYSRRYRETHKDQIRERRSGRSGDPEKLRAARERYKLAHPDRVIEQSRRWRAANRDKCKERAKAWALAHPDVIKKIQREWNSANHEKVRSEQKARYHVLLKEQCEICGAKATARHHPDYSKPLEVMHLCSKCHMGFHPRPNKKNNPEV